MEVVDYPQYVYEQELVDDLPHVLFPRQSYPSTDDLDRGTVDYVNSQECLESVAVIAGPYMVSWES